MSKLQLYQKRVSRSLAGDVSIILFLLLVGCFMAIPMVYAIGNAFKPLEEFWVFPPHFLPQQPTLQNFIDLSTLVNNTLVPFSRYMFNTVFITVTGTAGLIILASMCAYPLAKRQFPGRTIIFNIIVLALMFNGTVTAIPNYVIMSKMRIVDTYAALILPAFGLPIGLYLMKQFMEQMIPNSVLESANIDGANDWQVYWKIIMPMVKPAWLTLIIFSVQMLWGIGGNVMIYSEQLKTLSYALNQIATGGIARAGVGGTIGLIMMIVPIGIFLITQSNIIETMSTSGMKD